MNQTKLEKNKFVLGGMWILLGVLILTACGGGANSAEDEANSAEDEALEFSSSIPLGFPLGREELVATDPNTVSLVTGEPQIIEFFAFW